MEPSVHDFLAKSLLNEQELVRDYQRFAMRVDDSEIGRSFREWAEEDGHRARKIEYFLHQLKDNNS